MAASALKGGQPLKQSTSWTPSYAAYTADAPDTARSHRTTHAAYAAYTADAPDTARSHRTTHAAHTGYTTNTAHAAYTTYAARS